MKTQRETVEIDLYVEHRPLTEKEMKETSEFIKNYKKKRKLAIQRTSARKKRKLLPK
jgi:hypothetical protein